MRLNINEAQKLAEMPNPSQLNVCGVPVRVLTLV